MIAPPVDSRRAKLASWTAERIIADVIDMDWPVGEVLGSEAQLVERYGISRAVFREAVRLIEHQHVARMRRGPGGGLVVDEPDVDAVISAVILYLLRVNATLDEVFDARIVVEEIVAELAPGRVTDGDIGAIRSQLADEASGLSHNHRLLHAQLARATRNPVLDLFVETLNRVSTFYFSDPNALPTPVFSESRNAHGRIAAAVVSNKPGLARDRMRRHLLAEAEFIRGQPATVQTLDPSVALNGSAKSKRAEAVARTIFADMIGAGLAPGAFVGSESALMTKHAVSRSILREAIRILEYHDIVLMRRGPHGGLFVAPPSAAAVTDIVAIYLRRRGISPEQLAEVRVGIELAIIDRVSTPLETGDAELIKQCLELEADVGAVRTFSLGNDLHALLASLAGNRALELVHRVTLRLAAVIFQQFAQPGVGVDDAPAEAESAHRAIAAALISNDRDLAVRRLRTHLAEVPPTRS